jgi:protein-S-isoprenylcysteine O-methyltransferase Ste14
MGPIANSTVIVCWVIFVWYWLISAVGGKKVAERQSVWSALAHRIFVGMWWWFLVYPGPLPAPLRARVLPHTDGVLATGAVLCVLGLVVTIWARRTLAGNWSSNVTFKQGHQLVRTGPYRFVRHPIYTGLLVMAAGSAVEIGQLRGGVGFILLGIGFWIKLWQEERLLLRHFPEEYARYRKQVKALVPWIL